MSKKGIFFSVMSLLIVILFVSMTEIGSKFEIEETELDITRTKVKVLNSLVRDMENSYFERIVYVSVKNSIRGLSRYYYETGFDNTRLRRPLKTALNTMIQEGIIIQPGNNEVNLSELGNPNYINFDYTIKGLLRNLSEVYNNLGMNITKFSVNITEGSLIQKDPWTLQLDAEIGYHIQDKEGIVSWKGTTQKTVLIPIYGFYAYDYEDGNKDNFGKITSEWSLDMGPILTEPSFVDKLSTHLKNPNGGKGICSPLFDCETDVT